MNDNEIKRVIDASTENPESGGTEISAEEVKSLVMAKIGSESKNPIKVEDENAVYVKPAFVTVSSKRKPNLKIAAVSVAACLGIVCAGGYLALEGIGGNVFGGGTGEVTGFGGENGSDIVLTENPQSDVLEYTLLDGYKTTFDYSNGHTVTSGNGADIDILELRNGELWFIGNGENINVAEMAGYKSYYIYTYYNIGTQSEHKVVVSNTNEPLECGYFEFFGTDKEKERQSAAPGKNWKAVGRNCYMMEDLSSPPQSGLAKSYRQWVYDAAEELGFALYDEKTAEKIENGETIDMSKVLYITGSAMPIFTKDICINIRLMMDGEQIDYLTGNLAKSYTQNSDTEYAICNHIDINHILEIKDGCLWVNGNDKEALNITELAKGMEYYIYTDICEGRNHTFVVRNTTVPEECGYFETFDLGGYFGRQAVGRNIEAVGFGFIAAEPNKYKDWVYNALEELGLEITEAYSEETIANDKAVHMDSRELPYKVPVISGTEEVKSLPGGYALAEKFELMSGDTVRLAYVPNDPCPHLWDFNHKGNGNLFVTENGRLFFIGNNEHIDITDEIGKDKAYIYSYTNPVRNKLHYIVAGGSAENFAYAEIFPMCEDETNGTVRWASCGMGMESADGSPSDADMGKLMSSALNSLNIVSPDEMYYADAFSLTVDENGVSENVTDGGDLNQGVPPLPDGVILDEEFKLLDSSVVRFVHKEDETGSTSSIYPLQNANLFANENGRTYFVGNGEHIDITDSIDSDRAYIYTYTHPERNSLHYFIVGGNADNFGYAEVYPGPGENQWICNGTNCWFADDEEMIAESQKNSDSGAKVFSVKVYRPWLKSALNELANRYGIILTQSNNSNHSNGFTYLFSAE